MNQASLYLYTIYGKNAHRRDLPFELSEQRFLDLTKSNCYYCGSTPATVVKRGKDIYVYNGIDRKNNTIGYTINNSVSCCGRCNKMKFDLSVQDFISQVCRIYTHLEQDLNRFTDDVDFYPDEEDLR